MATTLAQIDAIWQRQAVACFASITRKGDCKNIATVLRDGREIAAVLQRDCDDDEDVLCSWREMGEFAAAMRCDTLAITADTFMLTGTEEEFDSPDFVRPRENPLAREALQSLAFRREGVVATMCEVEYGRGDNGEIEVRGAKHFQYARADSATSVALIEGMQQGRRGDPDGAVKRMIDLGYTVMYRGKVLHSAA